jgi:hypothetical protein
LHLSIIDGECREKDQGILRTWIEDHRLDANKRPVARSTSRDQPIVALPGSFEPRPFGFGRLAVLSRSQDSLPANNE